MARIDDARTAAEEIVVECEIDAAPEKLWHALTDDALASDWLGAKPEPRDADGATGPRFRILEAEPYTRVLYAWRDEKHPDAPPSVTVELERLPGGNTRFRLTHGLVPAVTSQPVAANANKPPMALAA